MNVRLYPKIYSKSNLKRYEREIDGTKPVILNEKYDGSNVALKKVGDKFEYYSRNKKLGFEPTGNFKKLIEFTPKEGINEVQEGDIIFCEYIYFAQLPYNKTHQRLIAFETKEASTNRYKVNANITLKSGIMVRDNLISLVEGETQLSKIDKITPIEGLVIKQLDSEGYIIAREKIVNSKFAERTGGKRKEKKVRFTYAAIEKYRIKLVNKGVLTPGETDLKKIMITMFKNGNDLYEDFWEEQSQKELNKLKKSIRRDMNDAIKAGFLEESDEKRT